MIRYVFHFLLLLNILLSLTSCRDNPIRKSNSDSGVLISQQGETNFESASIDNAEKKSENSKEKAYDVIKDTNERLNIEMLRDKTLEPGVSEIRIGLPGGGYFMSKLWVIEMSGGRNWIVYFYDEKKEAKSFARIWKLDSGKIKFLRNYFKSVGLSLPMDKNMINYNPDIIDGFTCFVEQKNGKVYDYRAFSTSATNYGGKKCSEIYKTVEGIFLGL